MSITRCYLMTPCYLSDIITVYTGLHRSRVCRWCALELTWKRLVCILGGVSISLYHFLLFNYVSFVVSFQLGSRCEGKELSWHLCHLESLKDFMDTNSQFVSQVVTDR
jgi:hypothetical protein